MNRVRCAPGRATCVGHQFGNYLLEKPLGYGASATVFLSTHRHLHMPVAIKIPHGQGTVARQRFHQEARLAAPLVHPAIVRVLDYGVQAGQQYLVTEYAPEGTLSQFRGMALPLDLVVEYAGQIASGLDYLSAVGIVHCDIKPSNLLIGRDEQILISDFGIARFIGKEAARRQSIVMGTPAYIAPEQILGHPCAASDQYALAVVVYELLTGDLPFGETETSAVPRHLRTIPPSLQERGLARSSAVEAVIMRALAKDPQQRYESAGRFAQALRYAAHASSRTLFVPTAQQEPSVVPPVAARTHAARAPRAERRSGCRSAPLLFCGSALTTTFLIWLLSLLQYSVGQIVAALLAFWCIACLFALATSTYRKTALLASCIAALALLIGLMWHSILAAIGTALLLLVPSLVIALSLFVRRASRGSRN